MNRFALGHFSGVILDVGHILANTHRLFANAPAVTLVAALAKYRLSADTVTLDMHPLVIDTGAHRVLIDPGGLDETPDALMTALKAAEIDPASIDTVIVTHGHADHYRGCMRADGALAFPGAAHYLQRAEWDYWLAVDNPEPYHAETFRRLMPALKAHFTLLDGVGEIVPGIRAVSTPGHSPAHMALLIGERLMYVADVLLHPALVEYPDWFGGFDIMPEAVVETRRRLLRRIADEDLWVSAYHYAAPGTGRILPAGDTWTWLPRIITEDDVHI